MASLELLKQLAATAEVHAQDVFGCELPLTIGRVDRILDSIRLQDEFDEHLDSIVSCYGAWFGEVCIAKHNGEWFALDEPVPPRIRVFQHLFSPMDAVARRLSHGDVPKLAELLEQLPESRIAKSTTAAPTLSGEAHYLEHNRAAWDVLTQDSRFAVGELPESSDEALRALDPWLIAEGVAGKKLLCLAAGGGRHGPLYAMAGADVTVVDFSSRALEIDRAVASELKLSNLRLVQTDMSHLEMFEQEAFQIVLHPVSLSYVDDPGAVYTELARVMVPGGLYVSQQKSPISLQMTASGSEAETRADYFIEHLPAPDVIKTVDEGLAHRESATLEWAHSLDALVGGLCRCGFVIEDLVEPVRQDAWAPVNSAGHRARYAPPYLRLKARKISG